MTCPQDSPRVPKLNEIWKTFIKQGFWLFFVKFWHFFHFLQFYKLSNSSLENFLEFFNPPDTPVGMSIVEWNKFWSFRSLWENIFVTWSFQSIRQTCLKNKEIINWILMFTYHYKVLFFTSILLADQSNWTVSMVVAMDWDVSN